MKNAVFAFLAILLLLSPAFAASGSQTTTATSNSQSLYELPQTPSDPARVTTTLAFTQKTDVSTSATVLQTGGGGSLIGATVCPGTFSLTSTSSGTWGSSFYARVNWYYSGAPAASSANPTNLGIRFHNSDYNALTQWTSPPVAICMSGDGCYGHEGSLTNRRIDIYERYPNSADYTNRLGGVSYTCAAEDSMSVSAQGGSSVPSFSTQQATGGTSFSASRSATLNSEDTYYFSDAMKVKGCAAVVRYPNSGQSGGEDERIFSRTSASLTSAPEYSKTATNSFTITVEDRQNSIVYVSRSPSGTLTLPQGEPVSLMIRVRNDGDVSTTVTDVDSSSSLVSVTALDVAACQLSGAIGCPSSNGFNTAISAGATRDLYLTLTASTSLPVGTHQWTPGITFTYTTSSTVCNDQTDTLSVPMTVTVTPPTPKVTSCTITPATANIGQNEIETFSLACYEGSTSASCPSTMGWYLKGFTSGYFYDNDTTRARIWVEDAIGSTGQLNATVTHNVSCVSALTVVAPDVCSCQLSPNPATVVVNVPQHFGISCFNPTNPTACSNVQWNLFGITGSLSGTSNTGADVTATATGSGNLRAIDNVCAVCRSQLTASTSDAVSCTVIPSGSTIMQNVAVSYNGTCYNAKGAQTTCVGPSWALNGLTGTLTPSSSSNPVYATVSSPVGASGTLNFTAVNVQCGVALSVVPASNATRCTVTPASASVGQNMVYPFTGACYDSNNAATSCTGAYWTFQNLAGGFIPDYTSNPVNAYVTSAVGSTGALNFSVGTAVCGSALTVVNPSCTITIVPATWSINVSESVSFTTQCQCGGATVACQGVQWAIMPNGLTGALSNTSDTGATFTGSAASTGQIRAYETGHGMVGFTTGTVTGGNVQSCTINVTPSSWQINVGQSVQLTPHCYCSGVQLACQGVQWSILSGGLNGTLSGTSDTGATFTGNAISSGYIRAYETTHAMEGFSAGGVGTTPPPVCTVNCDDNPDGDSDDCRIRPNPFSLYPGAKMYFSIWCNGPAYTTLCPSGTMFSKQGPGSVYPVTDSYGHVLGAYVIVSQPFGKYTIGASVPSGTTTGSCSAEVSVGPASCVEFT